MKERCHTRDEQPPPSLRREASGGQTQPDPAPGRDRRCHLTGPPAPQPHPLVGDPAPCRTCRGLDRTQRRLPPGLTRPAGMVARPPSPPAPANSPTGLRPRKPGAERSSSRTGFVSQAPCGDGTDMRDRKSSCPGALNGVTRTGTHRRISGPDGTEGVNRNGGPHGIRQHRTRRRCAPPRHRHGHDPHRPRSGPERGDREASECAHGEVASVPSSDPASAYGLRSPQLRTFERPLTCAREPGPRVTEGGPTAVCASNDGPPQISCSVVGVRVAVGPRREPLNLRPTSAS